MTPWRKRTRALALRITGWLVSLPITLYFAVATFRGDEPAAAERLWKLVPHWIAAAWRDFTHRHERACEMLDDAAYRLRLTHPNFSNFPAMDLALRYYIHEGIPPLRCREVAIEAGYWEAGASYVRCGACRKGWSLTHPWLADELNQPQAS